MMNASFEVLYVSASGSATDRPDWVASDPSTAGLPYSHRSPESMFDPAGCDRSAAVIVDGGNLGARAVETVRRLRWLGFDGPVVLTGFGKTELDRILALEAGASAVYAGVLPAGALDRHIGMPLRARTDGARHLSGPPRHAQAAPSLAAIA